ncbi:CPBP family intramembrane glutamic endopeptidase [Pseudooceanicola sp.]|uniref:CPBP family intramembrane glutamic endopeptidase n=1 Tax=Pseudooceanicola sp. TaxID=1914328 RepID=UPI0035C669D0
MNGYHPHEAHVAPARGSAALLHTIVGFCAIEFLYGLARDALDFAAFNLMPVAVGELLDRVSAAALLYDLFAFLLLAAVVVLVVRLVHRRGLASLLGDRRRLWRDGLRGTLGGVALFAALEFVMPWWDHGAATRQSLATWAQILPWALLALLVQTTAEEIFYRGYLQQQIAARFASPLVWMTVPNMAFAAVHWFNGEAFADSVQYVLWAFAFGLAASDLTARTGSLGAAIGFHLANNIFAFLIVGEAERMDSGLALFLLPSLPEGLLDVPAPPGPILSLAFGSDLLILALAWLAVRVAIRR